MVETIPRKERVMIGASINGHVGGDGQVWCQKKGTWKDKW